ncbi:uracil-DNA glycosylase family protein [Croceimicrobium sp.]|uniref:uracil-DNA glycosylase family protein n=1 Tax=Croceimicrobium sp. TaxID=2828340 RepID=UPI003BACD45E
MQKLLKQIKSCTICAAHLTEGVNPILSASPQSKIVLIGQAPGSIVHRTGIPWDDRSGDRLRDWMAVSKNDFYREELFALIPMGFCYPGKGKSGDLAPRPECAPQWHQPLLSEIKAKQLILLIGSYAQKYYLGDRAKNTLTETVKNYTEYLPQFLPLPHPSPRNTIWLKKNPWFEESILPILRKRVQELNT